MNVLESYVPVPSQNSATEKLITAAGVVNETQQLRSSASELIPKFYAKLIKTPFTQSNFKSEDGSNVSYVKQSLLVFISLFDIYLRNNFFSFFKNLSSRDVLFDNNRNTLSTVNTVDKFKDYHASVNTDLIFKVFGSFPYLTGIPMSLSGDEYVIPFENSTKSTYGSTAVGININIVPQGYIIIAPDDVTVADRYYVIPYDKTLKLEKTGTNEYGMFFKYGELKSIYGINAKGHCVDRFHCPNTSTVRFFSPVFSVNFETLFNYGCVTKTKKSSSSNSNSEETDHVDGRAIDFVIPGLYDALGGLFSFSKSFYTSFYNIYKTINNPINADGFYCKLSSGLSDFNGTELLIKQKNDSGVEKTINIVTNKQITGIYHMSTQDAPGRPNVFYNVDGITITGGG